ncbi:MarR family transcriptional regulator [Microtetraspora malaysiensis]|uniref:MarR family transcriptional regulator n=1 Tax=Microtetraspora malaysiensis TaxID=161358 RepID=UPI003D9406F0
MGGDYLAGPQGLLRSINARAVLAVIDREGPLGRPEITRATGLSKTTVAQALRELVAREVVDEAGTDTARRGPAATLYRIAPAARSASASTSGTCGSASRSWTQPERSSPAPRPPRRAGTPPPWRTR